MFEHKYATKLYTGDPKSREFFILGKILYKLGECLGIQFQIDKNFICEMETHSTSCTYHTSHLSTGLTKSGVKYESYTL